MNNASKEFRPTNELGVFYIFSRNHEKLGYSSIVEIRQNSAPDIIATTLDGKKVGIELEYDPVGAFGHYRATTKKEQEITEGFFPEFDSEKKTYPPREWIKDGNLWKYNLDGKTLLTKEDLSNQFWFSRTTGCLLHKTVKTIGIDIIIYWESGDRFRFWEFDKEIKHVNLQEELARIQGGKRG